MRVVVPFDAIYPKTRLGNRLTATERASFDHAMLRDVVAAIRAADCEPVVVATAPVDVDIQDAVDDRGLSAVVNAVLANASYPIGVVMADLLLVTGAVLQRLLATDDDVVLAPGRGGSTNAILVRHDDFRVNYHGASYLDHRTVAREIGATMSTFDSYRISTDIDEPADLPEVLLHGVGAAYDWLQSAGFRLVVADGRVEIAR